MTNLEALEKYSKDNKIWITELDEIPGWFCIWNPSNLRMMRNNDEFWNKSLLIEAIDNGYEVVLNELPI